MELTANLTFEKSSEEFRRKSLTNSIAMTVILVSFSMLFATLLLGYAVVRFSSDVWPPMGFNRVDLFIPTISTLIIALSSLSLETFFNKGQNKSYSMALFLTTFSLALLFMASQLYFWYSMKSTGLLVSSGVFSSILYGFTWIHAAHVVMAMFGITYLLKFVLKNKRGESLHEKDYLNLLNIRTFWHFLGLVWLIMYVGIFVL